MPAAACNAGAACTKDCTTPCRGGTGTISCICNTNQLFCSACVVPDAGTGPDAGPALCPAAPAGKNCPARDAVCSERTDAGTVACFCGDNGVWLCPGSATPPDGGFAACPKNAAGSNCPNRDQTCSDGAGVFCFCDHNRTWTCSSGV
jgi:hypothetical protein